MKKLFRAFVTDPGRTKELIQSAGFADTLLKPGTAGRVCAEMRKKGGGFVDFCEYARGGRKFRTMTVSDQSANHLPIDDLYKSLRGTRG